MDDYPTKAEAKGSRKRRRDRNPYARDLADPKYRQRVRKGKKNGRRRNAIEGDYQEDLDLGDDSSGPLDDIPGDVGDWTR